MKRTIAGALLTPVLLALSLLSSCGRGERPFVRQTFVMGTRGAVTIYGLPGSDAAEVSAEAVREMHRIESVMSTWKEDSELSRLNRNSRGRPVTVSAELAYLLNVASMVSRDTGGAFDITAGPLVKLWGFQGGEARRPSKREIGEVLQRVGRSRMLVDMKNSTVTLLEGARIDVAGIAKGYAVDRCAEVLRRRGVGSALVDIGGNMFAIGAPPRARGVVDRDQESGGSRRRHRQAAAQGRGRFDLR